jgi:putative spermidine/putrescine transport system permease protein
VATTLLVIPLTLGTVLIAEGMLTYFGPKGWLSQMLQFCTLRRPDPADAQLLGRADLAGDLGLSRSPSCSRCRTSPASIPALPRAAATLGASPWNQFRHIYLPLLVPGLAMAFALSFVQAFSVFPSAVLLGSPAGPTRVISIAAYEAAFERYDYSMASAVAMVMGVVQLFVVAAVLGARGMFYGARSREARVEPWTRVAC